MKSEQSGPEVFQIKITLDDIKPPIWRRVLLPGNASLADLHFLIQDAMGWENGHLHEFEIAKKSYGPMNDELDTEWLDESEYTLNDVFEGTKASAKYTYDFGDSWVHTVNVEKRVPYDDELEYPMCVAGERACPPEDCGGVCGYLNLVEALANPESQENQDTLEYFGDWDPEYFDVDEANEAIHGDLDDEFDDDEIPEEMSSFTEETAFRLLYYIREDAKKNLKGEELEAVLAQFETMSIDLLTARAADVMAKRPAEMAQMLGTAAFATEDPDEAANLAQDALNIDPENSDALLVMASMEEDVNVRIPKLREAFALAERRLGTTPYATDKDDELAGIFVLPYLRASVILLVSLLEVGDTEGASQCIDHALQNDPKDLQHTRVKLLQSCLIARELDLARKVLSSYLPDDQREYDELLWGRILERYLAGDIGGARDTLKLARERNPFAELYYTDDDAPDPETPEDEELDFEADRFHASIGYAWESHPLALAWLRAECARK
ncbi:MAG: hypothetical protein K1Y02_05955 [Candidatus Hydrogenedentes bacterium]|nr:hypothetical protein [Candidatus Hydrogenedentota bacterium]